MLLLWNMVKRFFDEDWTAGVFLAANMFLWTALSCGVGMLFCMVAAGAEAATHHTDGRRQCQYGGRGRGGGKLRGQCAVYVHLRRDHCGAVWRDLVSVSQTVIDFPSRLC